MTPALPINKELDVSLYFHDDIPSIENTSNVRQVSISYKDTYDRYIAAAMIEVYKGFLEDFYITNNELEKIPFVEAEVDSFFMYDVKKGYEELELYTASVLKYFKTGAGLPLSIEIQGFASQTARTPDGVLYNEYLSSRRINSVKNYLLAYEDGALKDYINDGRLKIEEIPINQQVSGLTQAEKDKIRDNPNSFGIYSPLVARTRKVTIRKIRFQ